MATLQVKLTQTGKGKTTLFVTCTNDIADGITKTAIEAFPEMASEINIKTTETKTHISVPMNDENKIQRVKDWMFETLKNRFMKS